MAVAARTSGAPPTRPVPKRGKERTAGALSSGLDVLEELARHPEGVGVSALATLLGADKGNVHRLLRVLEARGYVEQDPVTKLYAASAALVSLAGTVLRGLDLVNVSGPYVRALAEQTGEAVHLARRTRFGGVYVAQERRTGVVTVETEIGAQPVLHATATGKALLCASDDELWQSLIHEPLQRFTPGTLTTVPEVRAELAATRERGWAVDDEELTAGVRCVAAPVFGADGALVGCIGVSAPATRLTHDRLDEVGAQVAAAARWITHELGGQAPAGFGPTKEDS
jgi:IclR family acetate operon transcriptional repressor